ncbi:MAG: hypothetical protein A2Y54_01385 [Chloroflexi bacterium RBG_16_51_16]|nr:MAG: hypothetical protein A2Y54_01385 [Chloroflexi bacterium RBG_16_51_16]
MQQKRAGALDADRLGVLIASVLLTYALTRLIHSPQFILSVDLPGFYFSYPLSLSTAMTLLAAGLTATGMDWLLHAHIGVENKTVTEHLILPTLTTFVIGAPLALLPDGQDWWLGFGIAGILLAGVFLAEVEVVEPSSTYYGLARAGLTALAYALFLILVTALRLAAFRMFLLIPVVFLTSGLITLRILHLDGRDRWDFPWAVGIGLICTQIAAGLHYWPLTPIQYGLALVGPLYGLTSLSINLTENIPLVRAAIGPSLLVGAAWSAAILLR